MSDHSEEVYEGGDAASREIFDAKDRRIAELEQEVEQLREVLVKLRDSDFVIVHCGTEDQRPQADKERIAEPRRGVDNIKVRSYELGQQELHDMALSLLQEQGE